MENSLANPVACGSLFFRIFFSCSLDIIAFLLCLFIVQVLRAWNGADLVVRAVGVAVIVM